VGGVITGVKIKKLHKVQGSFFAARGKTLMRMRNSTLALILHTMSILICVLVDNIIVRTHDS
jgi:hypothetical protein